MSSMMNGLAYRFEFMTLFGQNLKLNVWASPYALLSLPVAMPSFHECERLEKDNLLRPTTMSGSFVGIHPRQQCHNSPERELTTRETCLVSPTVRCVAIPASHTDT